MKQIEKQTERINVRFTRSDMKKIERKAKEEGVPVSAVIRFAVKAIYF